MRGLSNNKFWCHLSVRGGQRYTNRDIRQSKPIKVKSFRELVPLVARISNFIETATLRYVEQSQFVDEFEMEELQQNAELNKSLKRGHQDMKAHKGRFVE